jgi:hypothetical protein
MSGNYSIKKENSSKADAVNTLAIIALNSGEALYRAG